MKNLLFAIVSIAIMLIGCAGTPSVASADFSGVTGNEWKLIEVRVNGVNTGFNRNSLASGDAFTLNFHAENISGVGAPNRYSAPYSLGEGSTITIMVVRATLMAPILEPDGLREHNFFGYVQNVYRWNLANNNLVLNSRTENGNEVILVFSL